jgi:hypothetical protein
MDQDWISPGGRAIIDIHDFKFTTVHNFIYYLYTGHVNMHAGVCQSISIPQGYPDPVDPFQLFVLSNMYLVGSLEEQCREVLLETCTPENICGRLFNIACLPYETLTEGFLEYLVDYYDEVKLTDGWSRIHNEMTSFSSAEIEFFAGLLLRISMWDDQTEDTIPDTACTT